ncbi:MAG: hypothetical protein JWN95_2589 [Frankiales bacterium]|nr:hypothetical protein [Frankiales bacterium]
MEHPHASPTASEPRNTTIGRRRRKLNGVTAVVLLAGLVATFAMSYRMAKTPGVFWTRVQVRFVSPQLDKSNGLQYVPASMIVVAGAVGKMIDPDPQPRLATAEATLVGEGVRNGYSVQLPNTGGQWANQFIDPYLDVQVVAPTQDEVNARTSRLVSEINQDLLTLQNGSTVPHRFLITTSLSPPAPLPIYYQKGSAKRAGLITLILGLGITFAATRLTRRWSPTESTPGHAAAEVRPLATA